MRKNSFDRIAPYYDNLAKLVFGNILKEAQRTYLPVIPPRARVLIMGGGTGWLLKDLLAGNAGCQVTYLEASRKMVDLSRRRLTDTEQNRVLFIVDDNLQKVMHETFDVVVCHFFLDLFVEDQLRRVITQLRERLSPGGLFLLCDFQHTGKWSHALLEKVMYWGFRLTCGIQAYQLHDYHSYLQEAGLVLKGETAFYQEMVVSRRYLN